MPKISVIKEHRRALDSLFSDSERMDAGIWSALRDLRQRIADAYDKPKLEGRGLSVDTFLMTAAPILGDRLALPPDEMRTSAWYGRIGALLIASGLTAETTAELARYVAGWAKRGITPDTLITKSATWLGAARADIKANERAEAAAPSAESDNLFDD